MPESAPVVDLITDDVMDALRSVQRASGWENDLFVEPPKPALGNARKDGLCVVIMGEADRFEPEEEDNAYMYWRQSYAAVCHIREPEASTVSIDKRMTSVAADVITKLMEDPRRGENAFDTIITGTSPNAEELHSSAGEIAVRFDVVYRHAYGDPRSK